MRLVVFVLFMYLSRIQAFLSRSLKSQQTSRRFFMTTSKPKVIILAGPTAVGKSDVAAELCESFGGVIVSADSVQAYKGVQIGANKPSAEEMARTPHLLVDVANHDDNYNAAEWRRDAIYCIRKLLCIEENESDDEGQDTDAFQTRRRSEIDSAIADARRKKNYDESQPIQPIVVGGTMMYLQWLVYGRPDAVRPSDKALEIAIEEITKFREDNQWNDAVEHVSSMGEIYQKQTRSLCGQDWYRLRRILEVAYTVKESNGSISTEDVYSGRRDSDLASLGFDVRCFFLCPSDRMKHARVVDERCEQMLLAGLFQETCELSLTRRLPEMAEKAIGYRQVLDYLKRESPQDNDESQFTHFLEQFTTATRRYAKKQMQWFRKDSNFFFVPVDLSKEKAQRVKEAAGIVRQNIDLEGSVFRLGLEDTGGISGRARASNEVQGKGMKVYILERKVLREGTAQLKDTICQADLCTARISAKKARLS